MESAPEKEGKKSREHGFFRKDGQKIRFAAGERLRKGKGMTSIHAERIAIRDCGKPKRRQIDREGITSRWERGYTQQEIADAVKCSTATVRSVLRQEGYEEVFSGEWGTAKVMRRERIRR